ncbi:MAG: malto-oligosyltrehalose synthase [Limisphaerales bacterium]
MNPHFSSSSSSKITAKSKAGMRTNYPRATYRLQFNEDFRLADALKLVPYLRELGVSHIYASPLTKACPHSAHGYDVCDFTRLNPELGTENDLEKLIAALRENKMGLVLDIVPNHMGIGAPENIWWWDVLKNGRASKFANYFDIDWEASAAEQRFSNRRENSAAKILLPVLGDCYDRVLKRGELQLQIENGEIVLRYFDRRFPLAPERRTDVTPATEKELQNSNQRQARLLSCVNSNPDALDELIQQQNYRLTFWKNGDAELNYRRFFSITSLAGICVEGENVFNDSHALVKKWLKKNWLDGLRVDHLDGLRDPENYLRRLRKLAPDKWIVVEKILGADENLPTSWPVNGTTGYDFINQLNDVFVDANGQKTLTDFYAEFTDEPTDYDHLVREKKRAILDESFCAEINRLLKILVQIAARHWRYCDFARAELRDAMTEMAACFPVYRNYAQPEKNLISEIEIARVEQAALAARKRKPNLPKEIFNFISGILILKLRGDLENEFVARFQQLTAPAMAKGAEDTAFYCFNRFISLNEVGGDPGNFGSSAESFHEFCARQQIHWPDSMLATSTHDTKRGEDVRARLNVLSEIPEKWIATVKKWSAMNKRHRKNNFPDRNAEYLFYQTLVGAWPISTERILAYMEKASREAKQHTNWTEQNSDYENALRDFAAAALNNERFNKELEQFVAPLIEAGQINSLAQTLLKLTVPGVPDFYQGTELWDFSLVDPDNRRAIDFELRKKLLTEMKNLSGEEIWGRRDEGVPKLWVIWKTLNLRAQKPGLFSGSQNYKTMVARGTKAEHIIAFMRGDSAIIIVPRFTQSEAGFQSAGTAETPALFCWRETIFELPPGNWRNEFTGDIFSGQSTSLENLFQKIPVVLLIRVGQSIK